MNPKPPKNLTSKQLLAATAIAAGGSVDEAATAAKCSHSTVDRWLKDEQFQEAIERAQWNIHDEAIAKLVQSQTTAIETLQAICSDTDSPASARVAAARSILDFAYRGFTLERVRASVKRLAELFSDKMEDLDREKVSQEITRITKAIGSDE